MKFKRLGISKCFIRNRTRERTSYCIEMSRYDNFLFLFGVQTNVMIVGNNNIIIIFLKNIVNHTL